MISSERVCSSGRMSSSLTHQHKIIANEQDASENRRDGRYLRRLPQL
jgi:hypothetical protein